MAERRLRVLMGLPPSDGRLMRPIDEPIMAKVDFDWEQSTSEAATPPGGAASSEVEIRRRELELIASKNFLMPRLDAVGRYRWRGFGDDLTGNDSGDLGTDSTAPYGDLATGDFQEWQLGFEFSLPIGFRRAHAAVRMPSCSWRASGRCCAISSARSCTNLADAIAEMDRTFAVAQTSYNRLGGQSAADEAPWPRTRRTKKSRSTCSSIRSGGWPRRKSRLLSSGCRIRDRDEERALREGDAARVRRRVSGGRAVAGRGLQGRGRAGIAARQATAVELRLVAGTGRRLGRDAAGSSGG